jgi:4-methyl-5(b-hydroxyethyl)-thiazole monophosphate biosynthesis
MVYIFLAEGFEEIEAVTIIDLLRRADIEIKLVYLNPTQPTVKGAHGISIEGEVWIDAVALEKATLLVFPGGMPGSKNLHENKQIDHLLKKAQAMSIRIAAICSAPMILGERGLLNGLEATSYPGFEDYLKGAVLITKKVVTDQRITTSRSPATAIPFALELIRLLKGEEVSKSIGLDILSDS